MKYLLIMLSEQRFSTEDFKSHLLTRWPGAILEEKTDPQSISSIAFEIPMVHSVLDGSMHKDGRAIPFDGDIRDVAEFVLWVRSFVPTTERLCFCDESMSAELDVLPSTSLDDIFQLYDYTPPPPGLLNYCLMARPTWTRSPQDFTRLIQQRWPAAQVELEPDTNRHRTVSFQVPMAHSTVSGSLSRRTPSLDFTGESRDCAEFSLWCYSILLAREVSVSNEKGHLVLHATTTVEDFLRALSTPPS
ncbi:MAG TPA: hypothetical protein VLQ93_25465 [Myxococcaceae bacterium]|nr:hypothetical protein [Myxococcaceae bacterium]